MSKIEAVQCRCPGSSSTNEGQSSEAGMTCYCPVDELLSIVSKKHALQIIAALKNNGTLRTSEIRDTLEISSSATLSHRLDELGEAGLIDRKQYDEIPPRVEYSLTDEGEELTTRFQPLLKWANAE